ncbi:leucine-rich repeat protein kinase family protein, partial [Striga asiatica]
MYSGCSPPSSILVSHVVDGVADVPDAGGDGGEGDEPVEEGGSAGGRDGPGDGGFTGAGGAPEDDGREAAGGDRGPEEGAGGEEVVLADDLVEVARPHPLGKRGVRGAWRGFLGDFFVSVFGGFGALLRVGRRRRGLAVFLVCGGGAVMGWGLKNRLILGWTAGGELELDGVTGGGGRPSSWLRIQSVALMRSPAAAARDSAARSAGKPMLWSVMMEEWYRGQ